MSGSGARVYLDWNATTPVLVDVVRAMTDAMSAGFANPESIHADGRRARSIVEDARAEIGLLVGADARDVIFTSSGTEANNIALRSAFAEKPGVLVTSRLEHPSVTRVAEALEREGRARVRWLVVEKSGRVSLADLERALADEADARLVAVQAVNHEHGVIQPLEEILALARAKGVAVHVDAVQAAGKMQNTHIAADTRSFAAHKIRGPKGVGALVTRVGYKLFPVLVGGAQEKGIRPGTVDAALAAGFGTAARIVRTAGWGSERIAPLRDALEARLEARGLVVVGKEAPRAAHVTCVIAKGWLGAELVAALDLEGISVSSGSACSAGTTEPSPVIAATLGEDVAARSVRFSLGPDTTSDEINITAAAVERVLRRVKG